ncbi:MAG: PilN domain-containing protein [Candidatus Daviesbacteria bacterium]|nr:PilN domain-containing protein [Candidatus Daviesbacteria bacterium]
MADINLLPVEDKGTEATEGIRKKLSIVSAVVLVATAVFGVVTLVMFTSFATQRQKIQSRIDTNTAQIDSLKDTEAMVVVTKDKASVADKVLTGRADQVNVFNQFSQLVPENVYFTDIKFIGTKATFSGKARSSADVAGFISSLASDNGTKIISNVNIDSLSSDQEGVYTFNISGQLATKASTSGVGEKSS